MELLNVYNKNRELTGRIVDRDLNDVLYEDEYFLAIQVIIVNSKNELLITKRAENKACPLLWEFTCGSVGKDETSKQGAIREVKEEIGLDLGFNDLNFTKTKIFPKFHMLKDEYIVFKNFDISELILKEDEVVDAKWVTKDELLNLIKNNKTVESLEFDKETIDKIIELRNKIK